ncbi:MAG: MMPL family transporter, partial [Acidimicrobiia bacterium]|nr:MMPL family transporter [Acidimicrobiia bacterium]
TSSVAAVQVVFTAENGDVLTADGLRTFAAVENAVRESSVGPVLATEVNGGIQGFFGPVLAALRQQGADLAAVTDAQVKQAYLEALQGLPPEVQGQIALTLSAKATDLTVPESSAGLMVVLIDTSLIADDPDQVKLQEYEVDMADRIDALPSNSVSAEPFSFALLFSDADAFASEIGRLFGTAFLIIIVILGFVFWIKPQGRLTWLNGLRRSGADVLLAMLVIVMSIVWMNGIGVLFGPKYLGIIGNFSEILQIIPILLIGLGVDYAIHLTSRYREELSSGSSVDRAAGRATKTVGVALILATVTTAVGFLTNIFSPVTAIKDFGILATVGIGAAFLLMLTFVPSVRVLLDRRAEAKGRLPAVEMGSSSDRVLPKLMGKAAVFAEKIPAVMLTAALLLGGLGAYGLTQLSTEFSFTDFLPEGSPMLETFDVLIDEFGGGLGETTNVLIQGDGVASAEVHNGLVASWQNLGDTPDVLSFGTFAAAESPVSVIAQLVTPPEQGGNPDTFSAEFSQVAFEFGLQPDLSVASGSDVDALYRAAAEADPVGMQRVLSRAGGSTVEYVNVAVSTQGGESGARDLASNLRDDFAPVSDISGISAVPTNENIISFGVVDALQSSQTSSLGITLAAAMALLVVTFYVESRRPFLGVITIAPVALVVLWVFGMMALTGISFNPVTAMIAAVAIGIGVPYTIHITHRYQEDRLRYDNEKEAIRSTMTHTGGALAGSAFTTVAGFG